MRTRREFLITAGRLGLGAAGVGAGVLQSRASVAAGTPRTVHLEAREVKWELGPGKTIKAMAYNGQVPGPTIRAREGERLRIALKNSLSEPTTIHWHGVDVPNAMDGVPGVTQKPVQPGETFTYEFEARPAGTRWYHTHFDERRQMDLGLAAPLIIEPNAPEPLSYDREMTLVLDDWATGTGRTIPDTDAGTAGGRGRPGGMMSGMMGGRGMSGMMGGGMMGGRGMSGMMRNAEEHAYDVMTINGKAYPATEPLRVKKGERVRLRFLNASAEHTHVLRLAGHRLAVTHTDGNPLEAAVEVDAVPIAPAERYDVVVTANHPGAWFLHCTQPGHVEAGERMLMIYEDHARAAPPEPGRGIAGLTLWEYGMGRGRAVLPVATGGARSVVLTLSGGMMGSDVWTINGKRYPDTDPIRCRQGDRLQINLRNNSMEAHPMHLHGQSFRVLSANGARYEYPIVKDVVDVDAHMGSADVELVAHNPGDWLFHCHKPMHMMGGMVSLVKVG
ncbi:MAG: multicopper oxidase family protein [Candidatus Rokuibacteriota bacterium]